MSQRGFFPPQIQALLQIALLPWLVIFIGWSASNAMCFPLMGCEWKRNHFSKTKELIWISVARREFWPWLEVFFVDSTPRSYPPKAVLIGWVWLEVTQRFIINSTCPLETADRRPTLTDLHKEIYKIMSLFEWSRNFELPLLIVLFAWTQRLPWC